MQKSLNFVKGALTRNQRLHVRRSPRGKGKSFANLFFLESEVTRMAIYSCNISNVSRAKGSSSCATFSYISGEKVRDERLGKTFRYGREERVILTETLLPEGAPVEFQNPVVLFNAIEKYENTDNARTSWWHCQKNLILQCRKK